MTNRTETFAVMLGHNDKGVRVFLMDRTGLRRQSFQSREAAATAATAAVIPYHVTPGIGARVVPNN